MNTLRIVLALGMMVWGTCSTKAGISLSPAEELQRTGTAPARPVSPTKDKPREVARRFQIVLSLSDGSRIVGVPGFKSIPFETSFAKANLDLTLLEAIEFGDQHENAIARLRNGDRLQGQVQLKKLEMETSFGRVSIPIQHVRTLATQPGEPQTGLILYYSFDKDDGDVVKNQQGEPLDGELAGATWTPNGKSQGALRFRGNGEKVVIPHDKRLDFGREDFSFCLWFKADHAGRQQLLWHNYNPEVQLEPDGTLLGYFAFRFCGTIPGKSVVPAGEWHFVAMTRHDGVGRLYLDGREENRVEASACDSSSPKPLLLGSDGESGEPFAGMIDELAIWKRALTEAEIQELYRNGKR